MLEFVNPFVQEEYDELKAREDDLLTELDDVQERIQKIESSEERA